MKKRKKDSKILKYLGNGLLFIAKLPYYYIRWAYRLGEKISKKDEKMKIEKKRNSIGSKHEEFKVISVMDGNYFEWIKHVSKSDSQIGIILGARGT